MRAELLTAYFGAESSLDEVAALESQTRGLEAARYAQHAAHYVQRVSDLWDEYVAHLPIRTLGRCPYTGDELARAIDDLGLGGLWWRHEGAARPEDPVPVTLLGITGAVRLAQPVERAPFLCVPGPGVPFVIPRLLATTQVTAVISSLPIGPHTGYALSYFSEGPVNVDPPNEWGLDHAPLPGGRWSQASDEASYDYELEPWVKAGRLRWIAPGDTSMKIREGTDGCPYLGLAGERRVQRIKNGEVW